MIETMNRRRFILGMLSLPAAAVAARFEPQIADARRVVYGGIDLGSKRDRAAKYFIVTNPTICESWVRRKYLESPESRSFKTKYINEWVGNYARPGGILELPSTHAVTEKS